RGISESRHDGRGRLFQLLSVEKSRRGGRCRNGDLPRPRAGRAHSRLPRAWNGAALFSLLHWRQLPAGRDPGCDPRGETALSRRLVRRASSRGRFLSRRVRPPWPNESDRASGGAISGTWPGKPSHLSSICDSHIAAGCAPRTPDPKGNWNGDLLSPRAPRARVFCVFGASDRQFSGDGTGGAGNAGFADLSRIVTRCAALCRRSDRGIFREEIIETSRGRRRGKRLATRGSRAYINARLKRLAGRYRSGQTGRTVNPLA